MLGSLGELGKRMRGENDQDKWFSYMLFLKNNFF